MGLEFDMRLLIKTYVGDSEDDCLPTLDYTEEKIMRKNVCFSILHRVMNCRAESLLTSNIC
jgi:hypothetical protein